MMEDPAPKSLAHSGTAETKECSSRVIYPRRRPGDDKSKESGRMQPVHVTQELLESVFNLPLYRACQVLVLARSRPQTPNPVFHTFGTFILVFSGNM